MPAGNTKLMEECLFDCKCSDKEVATFMEIIKFLKKNDEKKKNEGKLDDKDLKAEVSELVNECIREELK